MGVVFLLLTLAIFGLSFWLWWVSKPDASVFRIILWSTSSPSVRARQISPRCSFYALLNTLGLRRDEEIEAIQEKMRQIEVLLRNAAQWGDLEEVARGDREAIREDLHRLDLEILGPVRQM